MDVTIEILKKIPSMITNGFLMDYFSNPVMNSTCEF